jgi:siroheme synthase (precorrin-2 oxidase/ferrochelatase)
VAAVPTVLLIGEGDLAEETRQALDAAGADVYRMKAPEEREVKHALTEGGIDRVVVVSREDAVVLRTALMVRNCDPDVPMLVTIFDPTMAGQVDADLEHCDVTSMADIVAPSLAGPCLGDDLVAVREEGERPVGIRETADGVEDTPIEVPDQRRAAALASAVFAPYDKSAALLLWGALGLIVILVLETVACMAVLGQGFIDAVYGSAKTLVTVDPNDEVADGPKGLKAFLTVSMLAALVFEASFTAGLVNRLINKRLTGLIGRRAVPRRDHVVVVGMGQVGLRLCLLLRACGIGIVAVDDREEGENVGFAREFGFPVVIGRGADPSLLRRLSLERACALAAVTDDDLENISIAMAARSVNEDLRVVLRAGDGRVANETRSLFRIGLVRDVHRIAAVLIAARATGSDATRVVCIDHEAHLLFDDGRLEEAAVPAAN